MSCDPEWDDEFDVVITDTGMAGLATAIAAVDGDADVFLADIADTADPQPVAGDAAQRGWFEFGDDEATEEYRRELTADIDDTVSGRREAGLPLRLAGEIVPVRHRPRPPFDGERLREWTARCLSAPTGYLYTRLTDWTSELMDCGDGELVSVSELGSMTPDAANPAGSVVDWLRTEARDRGVSASPVRTFDRLVFEDGMVTGAVFSTDDGPLTVRALHGVLICGKRAVTRDEFYRRLPQNAGLRIALVGKEASRFGRIELLTSDAGVAEVAGAFADRADADADVEDAVIL